MKIQYEKLILRTVSLDIIAKANAILDEYAAAGYSMTLRQLYYQFVSRDLFPDTWISPITQSKNCQANYDKLSSIISKGRRAGLIDWSAIVDRTRFLRKPSAWEDPASIVSAIAEQFKLDLWRDQPNYIEVWFEKDALLGTFERACDKYRLPMISCRGYGSDSTWWEAAMRINKIVNSGKYGENKKAIILHFGDHDPSGLDMTRDIEARLNLFGCYPKVHRMALNMNQVREYNPPPNPAKETDSRFGDYQAEFGNKCWELDALPPDALVKLVNFTVKQYIKPKLWNALIDLEMEGRAQLGKISENFDKVVEFLEKLPD